MQISVCYCKMFNGHFLWTQCPFVLWACRWQHCTVLGEDLGL